MSYSVGSKGIAGCGKSRRAFYPLPENRLSCSRITFSPLSAVCLYRSRRPGALMGMLTGGYERVQRCSPKLVEGEFTEFWPNRAVAAEAAAPRVR